MHRQIFFLWFLIGLNFKASAQNVGGYNNPSHIGIGTDLLTDFSGTTHLYCSIRPVEYVMIDVAVGYLPFGYHIDFTNYFRKHYDVPYRDTALTNTFFYGITGAFLFESTWENLIYGVYLDYKKWRFDAQEKFRINKTKICFGYKYILNLNYGLSVDMHFGCFAGMEKVQATKSIDPYMSETFHGMEFDKLGDRESVFIGGLDFGLGINYNFNL